ncbi:unnamed protein product [Rotaria magnacalcarata]|uniref:G-protein coupled receptors family 1 profile domain-containing protein n=1 Tax=Rotaria magnacalcarata TaxID=392030 RepID=A0A814EE52_9BILA|nr:unnamed protein product [Rotaria magnacalcarata]CAF1677456.1 unnamed protein product [Rotaria magnacalcarata]CAF2054339.1 unnamed protein product [Rotaria magnacalcarata]CAF2147802.1 unnamed protein product [Rotaria magnacalcarata]CAF2178105.1 unnamed protein product [Rotaria magnacalcarata]
MNLSDSNSTEEPVEWFPGLQIAACIFYSIVLSVGIIGNVLVIAIVTKYRDMRNATNLLLTNLSIADLFHLLFCTAEGYQHLYGRDKYVLGSFMCSFSPFVQNATSTCSVLTIMAISYERYVAICQPLKTSSLHLTLFRTLPTVIFFWFISCLISLPFFMYSNTTLEQSTYNEIIVTCFTRFPETWANQYLISFTLCLYLLIFVMLCYWHFAICCILFNREALLRDNTIVTRYRRQVAQLLITLIITFFILILPYKIWAFLQQRLSQDEFYRIGFHRHSFIIIFTRSLYYLNSAINPLLYSIMSTKFRQSFFLLYDDCRRSSKSQRSCTVLFYKEHNGKKVRGANGHGYAGTISTGAKPSYHQTNGDLHHEAKSLLADHAPNPIVEVRMDISKCSFSESYI